MLLVVTVATTTTTTTTTTVTEEEAGEETTTTTMVTLPEELEFLTPHAYNVKILEMANTMVIIGFCAPKQRVGFVAHKDIPNMYVRESFVKRVVNKDTLNLPTGI